MDGTGSVMTSVNGSICSWIPAAPAAVPVVSKSAPPWQVDVEEACAMQGHQREHLGIAGAQPLGCKVNGLNSTPCAGSRIGAFKAVVGHCQLPLPMPADSKTLPSNA